MSTSPWNEPPEIAPELRAVEPIYAALLRTLHNVSRADAELPTLAAATAVVELAAELITTSGLLWGKPDMIAALRELTDDLEQRRTDGPSKPALATLREYFQSARPPLAN